MTGPDRRLSPDPLPSPDPDQYRLLIIPAEPRSEPLPAAQPRFQLRIFPVGPRSADYVVACESRQHAWALASLLRHGNWRVERYWITEPEADSPMMQTRLVIQPVEADPSLPNSEP